MKEKPIRVGEIFEAEITGISHQGWGIGRIEGFTVFVPGSLVGEIVQAEIDQMKKSFAVAKLIRVIHESPYRMIPPCHVYDSCGGCQLQHARYEHQLEMKKKIVEDALRKIAQMPEVEVRPVLGMSHPWQYRNRIQLHVKIYHDQVELGFFKPGSHELISFRECLLVPDVFNHIRSFLQEELTTYKDSDNLSSLRHIVLKISAYTKEIAVIFVTSEKKFPLLPKLAQSLSGRFPEVVSVVQNIQKKESGVLFGPRWQHILGKEKLEDKIGNVLYSISPGSFIQVNPEQTRVLYDQIRDFADLKGGETVLDVYCGMGSISLQMAEKAGQVIGIEEFPEAVKDADYNARLNGFNNVQFLAGKAEDLLPELAANGINPQLLIVDPPRKGCDPAVLSAIARMNPSKLIYVSCEPSTLARDLKTLGQHGYQVVTVQPVDMFPQTGHVETCVLLSHKKSQASSPSL
ncbi:23S rRNA (uracil(1939)-C(5))-methyltransferase RlmD [Dehalobacterium formicoaceticum]|uniref:23S rRNA (uracil(1939)-C(5))-methyltransferase RlmD n=1 Tax=Dehalobacterium formicoaceticum TaxID=51515 RepID=UPI0012FC703C|nr:23S rRNA (uracil(1939)-C(5))-methyltransferase RlmD [Dehalobacterium formicoaceticum]